MHSVEDSLIQIRVEERGTAGRVITVTVNNPAKRNILGLAGKQQLAGAFRRLGKDRLVRVVILTGAGDRSFLAGADLAEMKDLSLAGARRLFTWTHRACAAIRALPVPVIARINGYCFGAGMEIAASCDLRVGVTGARFGIPSGMEACLLPQLLGWGKTRELVYTGDHINAAEAYRIGFLEKLVEPAALDDAVERWVTSILAGGPRAIRLQKALVRDWERLSVERAIEAGIRACTESRRTDEPRRLMQAFLDRKKSPKA